MLAGWWGPILSLLPLVPAIAVGISPGFPPLMVFSSGNLAACQAGAFPRPGLGGGGDTGTLCCWEQGQRQGQGLAPLLALA